MTLQVDLFVYGTLMDESLLTTLVGRLFPRRPAELNGFQRVVPTRGYPYIIPSPTEKTQGFVLFGVDQAALAKLDQYEEEGHLYHRRQVTASIEGKTILCEAYVGNVTALAPEKTGVDPHRIPPDLPPRDQRHQRGTHS